MRGHPHPKPALSISLADTSDGVEPIGTGWFTARCSCMKPKRSFLTLFLRRTLLGLATILLGGVLGLAIMSQMLLSERKPSILFPNIQQEGLLK